MLTGASNLRDLCLYSLEPDQECKCGDCHCCCSCALSITCWTVAYLRCWRRNFFAQSCMNIIVSHPCGFI